MRAAAADGDDAGAEDLGEPHEHEADGPQTDDHHVVAGADGGLLQAAQHTRQRLDQSRILIGHVGRDLVHIPLHDAVGNADVLGVSAVVEEQVLAEVFDPALAVEAFQAGRRVGGHHALSHTPALDLIPDRDDITGEFVAE